MQKSPLLLQTSRDKYTEHPRVYNGAVEGFLVSEDMELKLKRAKQRRQWVSKRLLFIQYCTFEYLHIHTDIAM